MLHKSASTLKCIGLTYISPDGHDENLGLRKGVLHSRPSPDFCIPIIISKNVEYIVAKLRVDLGAIGETRPGRTRNINPTPMLDKELGKFLAGKLRHNTIKVSMSYPPHSRHLRELFASVNRLPLAVKVSVAHTIRVVITAVSITKARKPIFRIRSSTPSANTILTDMILILLTGMRCQSERVGVGLPDVDLSTTSAQVTDTSIAIAARGLPAFIVALYRQLSFQGRCLAHLSTKKLQITRTLRITVSCPIFCTRLINRIRSHATISLHRDKVQRAVDTTCDGGEVDVERKFIAAEVEHLILVGCFQKIQSGADVGTVGVFSYKVEFEGVAACADAVGLGVPGSFKGADFCALLVVRAGVGPLVPVVAVLKII